MPLINQLLDHFSSWAKKADVFLQRHVLAQPLVFPLQLADALLLGRDRLALPRLAGLLGVVLTQPTAHAAVHQVPVTANLANTQALLSDHPRHLQLENTGRLTRLSLHRIIPYQGVPEN